MKAGAATAVSGVLIALSDKEAPLEERARLLGYVQETLPAILPRLPPGSQSETIVSLEGLARDPGNPELRPHIERVLKLAREALKKVKAP